ncbi:MAG: MFS transporter [Myxococcaceae bacterium]|nr:MFS transporter [Myxococcaceae bacterium]
MTAEVSVAPAQQLPWWREPTRAQWSSFLAAWVGWILDAFDFTIFLLLMPSITKEFGVSVTATAGAITLTLLVRLLGGLVAGAAADRWGRKLPLMISILWFALCDGAVYFAPTFFWVLVLRTLFGFGMGAEWTSGSTLAMENWPERSRGIASGILQGGFAIGFILAGIVCALVAPRWGWRVVFLIAAVPALLVLPIRFWVIESPEWKKAAAKVKQPLGELLRRGLLTRLAWASAVIAFGFGAYQGLTGVYSVMLVKQYGLTQQGIMPLVILFNLGTMIGAVACGALVMRLGLRWAVAIPSLGVLPFLPLYVGMVPGGLAPGAFLGGLLGAACTGIAPLLLTSLFPPDVRGKCVGLVYHAGSFAGAFVAMGVAALAEHGGVTFAQAIALVVGLSEIGIVALIWLRPKSTEGEVGATAPALH